MKNVVIAHGKPSREKFESPDYPGPHKANWMSWAGREIQKRGYEVAIPQFPVPYEPDFDAWVPVLEKGYIGKETTLIGHSFGAGLLLRWMSENKPKLVVDQLVLVAPWLDPEFKYGDLNAFWMDPALPQRCVGGVALFYSSLDSAGVQTSVERIRTELPGIRVRDIPEYGHFLLGNSMTSEEFPELLEELA